MFNEAGLRVIYIHFSSCENMFEKDDRIETKEISLSRRFEAFTVNVYNVLNDNGCGILYLFDSLSELQTAWATDMMMENFFTVITPIIMKNNCKSFFPLIRGRHSLDSIEHIRSRTTVFLELYSDFNDLFMRPVQIDGQEETDINIPNVFDKEKQSFFPIIEGDTESHFRRAVDLELRKVRNRSRDSWDKFFDDVQRDFEDGRDVTEGCLRMRDIMHVAGENARRLFEVLESSYQSRYHRTLTFARLSEVIDEKGYPEEMTDAELLSNKPVSELLKGELLRLKRLK